jgi:X-X-X-Leu-X-X-Gly heptad repeat protein
MLLSSPIKNIPESGVHQLADGVEKLGGKSGQQDVRLQSRESTMMQFKTAPL